MIVNSEQLESAINIAYHKGFQNGYNKAFEEIVPEIDNAINKLYYENDEVINTIIDFGKED